VRVTRDQGWLVVDNSRWLHKFTEDGVTAEIAEEYYPNEFGGTIAHLGSLGWEMVSCANLDERHHAIYFKRPRPASPDKES
jgi:hypothetical protein